jgi:hypothetical protein
MGSLGRPCAPSLREALDDEEEAVREAATAALHSIGEK